MCFVFQPHRGSSEVSTVKMAEDDFAALEDNQVLVQASARSNPPLLRLISNPAQPSPVAILRLYSWCVGPGKQCI